MRHVSIGEASEILGISKEAIYNRIRRNSIRTKEINGVKYVILEETGDENVSQTAQTAQPKTRQYCASSPAQSSGPAQTAQNQNFIDYLIKEISELKEQIATLQSDKDRLHCEKEEILISSKEEIKLMYKERDEKLVYFLSFFEKPLLGGFGGTVPRESKPYDVEVKEEVFGDEWLSVSKYIKSLDLGHKKRMKAQSLIIENIGTNNLIRVIGNELLVHKDLQLKSLKDKK